MKPLTVEQQKEKRRRQNISYAINIGRQSFDPDLDCQEVCPYPLGSEQEIAFTEAWKRERAEYDELQNKPKCPFCNSPIDEMLWGLRCSDIKNCGYHTHYSDPE